MRDLVIAMCGDCTAEVLNGAEPCPYYIHNETRQDGFIHHFHYCKKFGEEWERCTSKTRCIIKILVEKMECKGKEL